MVASLEALFPTTSDACTNGSLVLETSCNSHWKEAHSVPLGARVRLPSSVQALAGTK